MDTKQTLAALKQAKQEKYNATLAWLHAPATDIEARRNYEQSLVNLRKAQRAHREATAQQKANHAK